MYVDKNTGKISKNTKRPVFTSIHCCSHIPNYWHLPKNNKMPSTYAPLNVCSSSPKL